MAKESSSEKRLRKEESLKDANAARIYGMREQLGTNPFKKNYANRAKEQQEEYYGTSMGRGAEQAGDKARKEAKKEVLKKDSDATIGKQSDAADVAERKAQREAAAEERREARGMKTGGSVSPSKKVLAKSGFYDKDKTKSEREKIVGKVTTKPQRVKMVEKMLSTKKMKSGGSVSKRADGVAIKGKTRGRMV